MTIAFIADLHGNWPATLALEKDLIRRKVDKIYCLGDLVGKGPSSDKTCDWVFANCQHIVGGNWDYFLSQKIFPKDDFYWQQLGDKRLEQLQALPLELSLSLNGQSFRLFHGRPVTGNQLLFPMAPAQEISPYFTKDEEVFQGIIYADFHRACYRVLNDGLLVNTGSVGNAMGIPKVFYVLATDGGDDASPFDLSIVSLPYDNRQAAQDAQETPHLPGQKAYIAEVLTGVYSRITKRS